MFISANAKLEPTCELKIMDSCVSKPLLVLGLWHIANRSSVPRGWPFPRIEWLDRGTQRLIQLVYIPFFKLGPHRACSIFGKNNRGFLARIFKSIRPGYMKGVSNRLRKIFLPFKIRRLYTSNGTKFWVGTYCKKISPFAASSLETKASQQL